MAELQAAIANARWALRKCERGGPGTVAKLEDAMADLLAALDAAQPVAYVWIGSMQALKAGERPVEALLWTTPTGQASVPLYATPQDPPAAAADCDMGIMCLGCSPRLPGGGCPDAPPAAVPAGYALVPVEPTPEIIAAGWFGGEMHVALGHANAYRECEGDYARMLAAARKGE